MGRNIYVREGCYLCHSQQIRPFKDEVERYGPYSLAAESMYDKPFQWGSKRTGPDLARVGGRYSNDWHVAHLTSPRAVVPESVMPAYPFLAQRKLEYDDIAEHLKALRAVGTPYTDEMIANARADLEAQVNPDADPTALLKRYPRAVVGKFNGESASITELDALDRLPADAGNAGALRRPAARAVAAIGEMNMTLDSVGEVLASAWTVWAVLAVRRHRRWAWRPANRKRFEQRRPHPARTTKAEDASCRPRSRRTRSPARTRPATNGMASRS